MEADGKRLEVIPDEGMRERLPRRSILRGKRNFSYLFRHGKRIEGSLLSCLAAPLPGSSGLDSKLNLAVIVHRNVGTAAKRNKIKRWVREAYRRNNKILTDLVARTDCPVAILFSCRKFDNCKNVCYAKIERDVQSLLEKLNHIK